MFPWLRFYKRVLLGRKGIVIKTLLVFKLPDKLPDMLRQLRICSMLSPLDNYCHHTVALWDVFGITFWYSCQGIHIHLILEYEHNEKFALPYVLSSLANTRLNHKWDVVWRPPLHVPVEEAWFPIVQSRLLGATNVYHKRLFVALSQSYQLYQMTYGKRQIFGEQASRKKMTLFLFVLLLK